MTSRVFVVVFPPPNSQFSFQFFFLFPSKRTRYFHRFYRDNKILYETAGPLCLGTHRAAVMCCWFCRITSLTEAIVAEEGQRLELRGARWKVEVSHIWMMNDCVWIKIRPTFLLFFGCWLSQIMLDSIHHHRRSESSSGCQVVNVTDSLSSHKQQNWLMNYLWIIFFSLF